MPAAVPEYDAGSDHHSRRIVGCSISQRVYNAGMTKTFGESIMFAWVRFLSVSVLFALPMCVMADYHFDASKQNVISAEDKQLAADITAFLASLRRNATSTESANR